MCYKIKFSSQFYFIEVNITINHPYVGLSCTGFVGSPSRQMSINQTPSLGTCERGSIEVYVIYLDHDYLLWIFIRFCIKIFSLSNLLNTFLIIHDITILLYDCCTNVVYETSFLLNCLCPNEVPSKMKLWRKNIERSIINTEDIEQLQSFEEMLMNLQKWWCARKVWRNISFIPRQVDSGMFREVSIVYTDPKLQVWTMLCHSCVF